MLDMLRTILALTSHVIWPRHCPACGRVGVSFCEECLESAMTPLPAFCLECGGKYGVPCCTDSVPCFAATAHTGLSRQFLINFKYRNARSIGVSMGRLIAGSMPAIVADLAVPIPLHRASGRGFNQSAVLLSGIVEGFPIDVGIDALRWRRGIGRQLGKSSAKRLSLPPGAITPTAGLTGKRVLLVDDVYTTGGTLCAAREAVARAGGSVAAGVVWSRRVRSGELQGAR